jgi:transposase
LSDLGLLYPAEHLVLDELVQRIERAEVLGERVAQSMVALLPRWALAPIVEAVRALPGISVQGAIAPIAEIGSFSRFETPRQLMACPGPAPSDHSSGSTTRREPIAKTGNSLAHTRLVEAAWAYRFPARVSRLVLKRTEHLLEPIRTLGWKAQVRLCRRYRHLMATGKAAPPKRALARWSPPSPATSAASSGPWPGMVEPVRT